MQASIARFYLSILILVPVYGGYTKWSAWSKCPVTCGGGIHQRTRTCTQPEPKHGGLTCVQQNMGASSEGRPCGNAECPSRLLELRRIKFIIH